MPAPRFFAYCYRLTAYQGVVAGIYRRQKTQATAQRPAAQSMSLAEWAAQHPHAIEAAYERAAEGR